MTDYLSHSDIHGLLVETCEKLGIPMVKWKFSNRFTSKMGEARPGSNLVRFSKPLWTRATVEERRQVIIHEVCHVAASVKYGRKQGHGPNWRGLMVFCGVKPDRCHSVDTSGLRRKRKGSQTVVCACPGRTHTLGPVRARKLALGYAKYTCNLCKTAVKLTEPVKLPQSDPFSHTWVMP